MDVAYAFLADAVQVTPDGKFGVLGGGVEQLWAREFPVAHPTMGLILVIQVLPEECGVQHPMRVELWDPDGVLVTRAEGEFIAQRRTDAPGRPTSVHIGLNFVQTRFEAAGDYAFHVIVNDQHLGKVPVTISLAAS